MGDTRKQTVGDLFPGTLDMLILKTLSRGPMHGYAIARVHPAGVARRAAGRGGRALSGAAPPRGARAAQVGVGRAPRTTAARSITASPRAGRRELDDETDVLDARGGGGHARDADGLICRSYPRWHRAQRSYRRRRLDRDLDDELAFHLAMREADYRQHGLATRRGARRRAAAVRQRHLLQGADAATCGRSIRSRRCRRTCATRCGRCGKRQASPLVAVVALASASARNTAIFSLVDAVRARALPYREPGPAGRALGQRACARRWSAAARRIPTSSTGAHSPRASRTWRRSTASSMTLAGDDEPERINTEFVSAPYFSLLGVSPARGRTFRADEDDVAQAGAGRGAQRRLVEAALRRRPQIVGRALTLNGARPTRSSA